MTKKTLLNNNTPLKNIIKQAIKESMDFDFNDNSNINNNAIFDTLLQKSKDITNYIENLKNDIDKSINEIQDKLKDLNIETNPIKDEIENNTYTMDLSIDLNQIKHAIINNSNLVTDITGEYGDYEGKNITDVLNNETDIIQIFNEYFIQELNINNNYNVEINDMRKYGRELTLQVSKNIPESIDKLKTLLLDNNI